MSNVGPSLPGIARKSVEEALGASPSATHSATHQDPALAELAATFVTITHKGTLSGSRAGELRGCIGSIFPQRPLLEDVRNNANAAAFQDPRFDPIEASSLPHLNFEVSLLSPMTPLVVQSEKELLQKLRPGIDGVVLRWQAHRGVFLPQVWDQLPHPHDFMNALKRKAGLPGDFWDSQLRFETFTVEKWSEGSP